VSRVGGRLDWIRSNPRRLAEGRDRAGRGHPEIEVRFLSSPHRRRQRDAVEAMGRGLGADAFYSCQGHHDSWAERCVSEYVSSGPRSTRRIPRCYRPYVLMLIKYDGSVIPCCLRRIGEQYTGNRRGARRATCSSPASRASGTGRRTGRCGAWCHLLCDS